MHFASLSQALLTHDNVAESNRDPGSNISNTSDVTTCEQISKKRVTEYIHYLVRQLSTSQ